MPITPSRSVIDAFGGSDEPVPLPGGEGTSVLVGSVVLKPASDVGEAAWVQGLLARLIPDDFRVAAPIAAAGGPWVHDGWIASRFLPDLRPAAPSWPLIIQVGERFSDAATLVWDGDDRGLAARTHRWAVADRVAWSDARVELDEAAIEVHDALRGLLGEPVPEVAVVHGDLSGNVFTAPDGIPVVLDVSPYLRPRRWGSAIVVADAVLWHGAPASLARSFVRDEAALDLLARALVFRLVAEDPATSRAWLPRYQAAVTVLTSGR